MRKDLRRLAAEAQRQGWSVEKTGGGHLKWVAPSGARVYTASTPSDPRAFANVRAMLRRAGLADE
jgi:hypothetical protein